MDGDGVVGPIFQESNDRLDLVQGMKDIATTRRAGHGVFLAGADAGAKIGDGGLGSEAAILAFHQTKSFVNAFGMFAAQKAAMVEEKLQQLQIAGANFPA